MPRRILALLVLIAAAAAGVVLAGPTRATTGVSTGLPQPDVLVRREDGSPFEGRFVLASIDRGARITGGQITAQFTETTTPYLVGFAEYGTFDNAGRQTFLTANLYPWSYSKAKGAITAQISSQGANEKLGDLTLRRPSDPGHLDGTLTLNGHAFAVSYRRVDEDLNLYGRLPKVQLTTPHTRLDRAGWGDPAAYTGRYRLASTGAAGANATVYAPLVELAHRLSQGPAAVLDASMTLRVDGGELTLRQPGQTHLLHLTDLRSGGDTRGARLHSDGPGGPVVGRLSATADGDELTGAVTIGSRRTVIDLERFAAG